MSFLNPVSEPVLRFSSTDANAPQINYNARTAGDVKAVLKDCLVTGYGTKASAGWSIVNEVDHVAEFVSPSAAMSDYRLGIDDTSTSSTTWYYQYQDARVDPAYNSLVKSMTFINKTAATNGWQLIVCGKGLYFVEIVTQTPSNQVFARLSFWGAIKSSINDLGVNIGYWNTGWQNTANATMNKFFEPTGTAYKHYKVATFTSVEFTGLTASLSGKNVVITDDTNIDVSSSMFITSSAVVLGEQIGLLVRLPRDVLPTYGVYDDTVNGRNVLTIALSKQEQYETNLLLGTRIVQIYTDLWEC